MTITHISSKDFSPLKWSGGLTTELFICPPGSSYAKRDFDFRLSTATVDVEKSTFTPLPTVNRTLMVLSGEMRLDHKNHHSVTLRSGEVDRFDGGWETASFGRCTDFNLMTIGKASGALSVVNLKALQATILALDNNAVCQFLYLNSGRIFVSCEDQLFDLSGGDLLAIMDASAAELNVTEKEKSQLILCTINP